MLNTRPCAAVLVLALLGVTPVAAFAADDVAALRAELEALKNDYANKVASLETRISQLESSTSGTAPAVATAAPQAGAAQGEQPVPTPNANAASVAALATEAAAAGFGQSQ